MSDYLENIFSLILEGDAGCAAASRKEARRAEPLHERLVDALGEEGEQIWDAAVFVGCAEALPAFQAGVRFGLRLMALCLEDQGAAFTPR